jgi:hypothetical protein
MLSSVRAGRPAAFWQLGGDAVAASEGQMRAGAIVVVLGLATAGVASVASAQVVPPPELQCSASQLGQPCGLNSYSTCTQTACFHIEDELDDAGVDAGVPTSCSACTACIQSGCLYAVCPAGSYCTGVGLNPASPLGGWGFGPPSNPDETTVAVPQYFCVDAGPQLLAPPTCPDPHGGAADGGIVAISPGGGSGSLDASVARYPGPSRETTTPPGAGRPSGSSGMLEAGTDLPAAPATGASQYPELGRACAMAPGAPAGVGAPGLIGVALGLLASRRRR